MPTDHLGLQPSPPGAAGLLILPQGEAKLSRGQRQFNTLMEGLQRLRSELLLWQPFVEEFRQQVMREVLPEQAKLRALQRETVLWIDAFLQGMPERGPRRLAKKRVRRLVRYMSLLAVPLLESGEDAALEAAFERHNGVSFQETRQGELAVVEAMIREMLGDKAIANHQAQDVEGLLRHAQAQRDEQVQAEADLAWEKREKAGKAGTGKPSNAAMKREQSLKQASQSVREIYRRLASALHPDREPDPQARARKTALMQRANQAHERGDLLDLLAMQVELEEIDRSHLARASEEKLGHYCKVLREQQSALKAELDDCQSILREVTNIARPKALPAPEKLLALLTQETLALKQTRRQMAGDLLRLQDPAQIEWLIDVLPLEAMQAQARDGSAWVAAEWNDVSW